MTIATGTKLGRYEIRSKIGEGGMGEVYLARDTQLGRDVAVKVLPSTYSDDTDRLHRFEQEACAASALNHPNILSIYDVGTHDGSPYVVSELLQGQTLRQRVSGTSLPQRKAMDYALEIARGLAAAHEKGIVHRDLKPDNLFITNDGRVKILDFGLAKLTGAGNTELSQTGIPTRRVDTDPGKVMGTVGYMSPEQLKGRAVDHRSDIFSFGAILYEMLSGRRAFHGESAAETMSAILKEDPPDLSETNQRISPALERLVNRCLEKNPAERFHSASDLAFALEALSGSAPTSAQTAVISAITARKLTRRELFFALVAAIALVAVGIMLALSYFRRATIETRTVRLFIPPPEKNSFGSFALSPDGRHLAFVATDASAKTLLWIRSLDSLNSQPLAGTEEAVYPFWSPDNRFVGFFAGSKLKKVQAAGGSVQTLCNAPVPRGGTWNSEGVILFAPTPNDPIYQVSAGGGEPTQVTTLDRTRLENSHRWPNFLPDGRHFIYSVLGGADTRGVYVGLLGSKEQRRVLNIPNSDALYAAPGYLLYRREATLIAQAFNGKTLQVTDDPVPIAEPVAFDAASFQTLFSVSETGMLAYSVGGSIKTQLVWVDRSGKQTGFIEESGYYFRPALSPDEKRVAVDNVDVQGNRDIWIIELGRGNTTRFTFDPALELWPVWAPDGSRIAFSSNRAGTMNLYQRSASGTGPEEVLLQSELPKTPMDWSRDGRYLLYSVTDPKTQSDLWALPMLGDAKPFPVLQTQFNERVPRLSRDGHWIAYTSDESGGWEVYVQTFPLSGGKWQISTNGGYNPEWRGDGNELFYVSADKKMMAVEVKGEGTTFQRGVPKALFDLRIPNFFDIRARFAVTADGQKFLINNLVGENSAAPIAIVLNWTADLKK
jgi:serine/threonine protein kinase/Tol biopolymer transport system component